MKEAARGWCTCNVLALRQLEHVLQAVDDLEGAAGGDLAHIPRVEVAVRVCTASSLCFRGGSQGVHSARGSILQGQRAAGRRRALNHCTPASCTPVLDLTSHPSPGQLPCRVAQGMAVGVRGAPAPAIFSLPCVTIDRAPLQEAGPSGSLASLYGSQGVHCDVSCPCSIHPLLSSCAHQASASVMPLNKARRRGILRTCMTFSRR